MKNFEKRLAALETVASPELTIEDLLRICDSGGEFPEYVRGQHAILDALQEIAEAEGLDH